MTLRERAAKLLLKPELQAVEHLRETFLDAYRMGPFLLSPETLIDSLKEYDSQLIQVLVDQLQYEAFGGGTTATDSERRRVVDEARRLWRYDVVTQQVIRLWTNYGFGENIEVLPDDETAQEVWTEFWTADRNQNVLAADVLHELSDDVLVDGEIFLAFYASELDGECTVREICNDQITELLTDPEDDSQVLAYKREWIDAQNRTHTLYYLDWQADPDKLPEGLLPRDAERADEAKPGTYVCLLHIAHDRKGGLRGWPLMAAGAPWSREHKRFRENRAAVSAAIAMYVQKIKHSGGTRAQDAIRNKLNSALANSGTNYETNPPAVAGSTWLENQAATLERLPMGTGASDAKTDGEALLQMAGLGGGVFPHYLGAGDAFRLATATSMEQPLLRQWSRYQIFWSAQFRKMARIVLFMKERYGRTSYETWEVQVSTDRLVETDLQMLARSVSALFRDVFNPLTTAGQIPTEAQQQIITYTWQMLLQAMGATEVHEMINMDMYEAEEAEKERLEKERLEKEKAETPVPIAVPMPPPVPEPVPEEPPVTEMAESHIAETVDRTCPLCAWPQALSYPDHKGLLVCAHCHKTYDPGVE